MKFIKFVLVALLLIPSLVYVGWFTNNTYLKSVIPGFTPMNPISALCFILVGIAFVATILDYKHKQGITKITAIVLIFFGLAMLLYYLTGIDLHVDRILFASHLGTDRLAPNTALNLTLTGITLMIYNRTKLRWLSYFLIWVTAFISVLSIIGYLYGLHQLFGIANFNPMAIHSAVCFLLINILISTLLLNQKKIYVNTQIILSLALILIVVVGSTAAAHLSINTTNHRQNILIHDQDVINGIDNLETQLNNATTAQRNYLDTGRISYVSIVTSSEQGVKQYTHELNSILTETRNYTTFLAANSLLNKRIVELNTAIYLQEDGHLAAANNEVNLSLKLQYLGLARIKLSQIEEPYLYQISSIQMTASHELSDSDWTLAISATVDVLMIMIAFFIIQKTLHDRDLSQKALLDSNGQLDIEKQQAQTLLASIGDGVFAIDKNGVVTVFNKAAEQISGYSAEEIIGKLWDDVLMFKSKGTHKSSRHFIDKALAGRASVMDANTVLVKKNGKSIDVADSAAPILNNNKLDGVIVVFRDATKERALDAAKDQFVSLVSHQLRTPLTSIRWFTEMLDNTRVGPLNDTQQDYLDKVRLSTERMISLVGDILNASRIELKSIKVTPVETNLKEFVESVVEEARPLADIKKVKLTVEDKLGTFNDVTLDQTLFGQVIHNLLTNAIRYTQENEGKVKLVLSKSTTHYILEVEDNGIGIPEESQAKLFDQFYRADNAIQMVGEGTGLGLYLVKMICELTGCNITCMSQENVGTTFTVTIPIKGMVVKSGSKTLQ
jgi:PAS domain S-box-containing protein